VINNIFHDNSFSFFIFFNFLYLAARIKREVLVIIIITNTPFLMQMITRENLSTPKNVQSKLDQFSGSPKTQTIMNENTSTKELKAFLNKSVFLSMIKEDSANTSNSLIEMFTFKTDFTMKSLSSHWAWMQKKDGAYTPEAILKNGFIIDSTQHVAIIISQEGLNRFCLKEAITQRESRLYHFSGDEIRSLILKARKNNGIITFENTNVKAELIEFLLPNLEEAKDFKGYREYSIAIILPKPGDDGSWPIIIKNDITQILGIIVSRSF